MPTSAIATERPNVIARLETLACTPHGLETKWVAPHYRATHSICLALLLGDDFGNLGTGRHLVGRRNAPKRSNRVGGRPLVVGVEAVAVDGEHVSVLVDLTSRELQARLQELLHLPLVCA